jgi:glucose-6-phosphate 1-epimerase
MHTSNTDQLNRIFGLDGKIRFTTENKLIKFIASAKASVLEAYLQGAHITSYIPHNASEVLWLSPLAKYEPGKAIRGGIPICWPWFGKHPVNPSLPQHGFARNSLFEVVQTEELNNGDLQIILSLQESEASLGLWPYKFKLNVIITLGSSLNIKLETVNTDTQKITISEAIHSYFAINSISTTQLQGLESASYYDQLLEADSRQANSATRFAQEVDRIYQAPANDLFILDKDLPTIKLQQVHGNAVVVWNPWIEKSKSMSDFPDNGYTQMLCVEAANTRYASIQLAPGEHHSIIQIITASELMESNQVKIY